MGGERLGRGPEPERDLVDHRPVRGGAVHASGRRRRPDGRARLRGSASQPHTRPGRTVRYRSYSRSLRARIVEAPRSRAIGAMRLGLAPALLEAAVEGVEQRDADRAALGDQLAGDDRAVGEADGDGVERVAPAVGGEVDPRQLEDVALALVQRRAGLVPVPGHAPSRWNRSAIRPSHCAGEGDDDEHAHRPAATRAEARARRWRQSAVSAAASSPMMPEGDERAGPLRVPEAEDEVDLAAGLLERRRRRGSARARRRRWSRSACRW